MGLKASETHPLPVTALHAPCPLWRHKSGSRVFDEYFRKIITKFIICSYPNPAAPARNKWRLFAVFEGSDEMLEIGWQLSEYPKPRLVFRYCTRAEFDAELPSSTSRDDFVTYGPPITEKVFTFKRLTQLMTTHGLLTCLVANIVSDAKREEYFSTWILTLLGVLLRNEHIDSSVIPKLAARISRTWKRDEFGKANILGPLDPEPVSFSSPIASEL
ncbi:unnamed protein product [Rhizoctonia solani]|uniref:Uncharacterized protein n=1 Tax=Rhizoctonia solani TaxID=456999 RepID=A0A8H3I2Z3_9AGAM|nr:unnamed protein product [Rhizoctonia solani]